LASAQIGFACNHFHSPHLDAARRIKKANQPNFREHSLIFQN